MTFLITLLIIGIVGVAMGVFVFRRMQTILVLEDTVAITVDKDGFIKRVLPAGRHILRPHEKLDFSLETKPNLATGRAEAIVTNDGILVSINWSGVYTRQPERVTEKLNQRLRGLLNAEKAIGRGVDITLRKLVGDYALQDLFKPAIRERIERQLSQVMAERVAALGIGLAGLDLQVIELPSEVAEALNKAKAIATLDGTVRQLDPTTREIIRGAYHWDGILPWDQYLPLPPRLGRKQLEPVTNG